MNNLISLSKSILGALMVIAVFTLTSCGKDPETVTPGTVTVPAAELTSYEGSLTYTSSTGNTIVNATGTATISKSGSTYKISFSDNVPTLSDLIFSSANGSYATISTDGSVSGIVIDDGDLDIGVTSGGNTWAFSGTR